MSEIERKGIQLTIKVEIYHKITKKRQKTCVFYLLKNWGNRFNYSYLLYKQFYSFIIHVLAFKGTEI